MATYLAIDWEQQHLCGLEGESARGAEVTRCFTLSWPESIDVTETPEAAGEWLKEQLAGLGVSSRQVLLTLPREDAVVRHLELPAVSDEELPDLVRFQASTKSALSLDKLCLDYMPLPQREDFEGRDVLMTTIAADRVANIRSVLTAAGLELQSISLTPVATAELVSRVEEPDARAENAASLILSRHGDRVEISVVQNHRLVFSHSTRVVSGDETQKTQSILVEVSRTSIALQKLSHGIRIVHAWVVGAAGSHAELIGALNARLDCEATTVDPLETTDVTLRTQDTPGDRTLYAGPVGMLLARERTSVEAIDFLNPRKYVEKRNWRQYRLAIAGGTAAVLLLTLLGVRWALMANLEGKIAERKTEIAEIQGSLNSQKTTLATATTIRTWQRKDRQWLEDFRRLIETMEGTERYYFSELQVNSGSGTALGEIVAHGAAKEREHVEDLYNKIESNEAFEVQPRDITPDSDDSKYPWQFVLEIEIVDPVEAAQSQQGDSKQRTTAKRGGRV